MSCLTYGGIPLLYDYQNAAQGFLDRYQRLEDFIIPQGNTSHNSWQSQEADYSNGLSKHVGMPRYNWPSRPPLRINELYWPTGATRFSYGLFLINYEGYNSLSELSCDEPHTLKLESATNPSDEPDVADPTHETITWSLFYLTPRPISSCEQPPNDNGLYLLPLVDLRYWWQFADNDDIKSVLQADNASCQMECNGTWNDLLTHFESVFNMSEHYGSVSSAYGKPDCVEMARQYQSAVAMFDAVAASIGGRVIVQRDGTAQVQSASSAESAVSMNVSSLEDQLAGSHCTTADDNKSLPNALKVAFPVARCYHLSCDEDRYTLSCSKSGYCGRDGSEKTIHTSAVASWDCACDYTTAPTNYSDLTALANKICEDWYAWREWEYDVTYARPQGWNPTGMDDHVLWSFGGEAFDHYEAAANVVIGAPGATVPVDTVLEPKFRKNHFTRVQSLPLSCDVDSMFHYLGNTILPDTVLIRITDCWESDDCCASGEWPKSTGQVVSWCSCDYTDVSGLTIPVYSSVGFLCEKLSDLKSEMAAGNCIPIRDGCCEYMWAKWNCEDDRWEVEAKYDDMWRFELTEDLCPDGCAEAELLLACCGGDLEKTGVTFQVCDTLELVPQSGSSSMLKWVEALMCIVPSDTTSTAKVLKWDEATGDLVDDTDYDDIAIDNSDCWILALPGERFKVYLESESDGSGGGACLPEGTRGVARFWPDTCEFEILSIGGTTATPTGESFVGRPATPFGLVRRVKIEDKIECNECGWVYVLTNDASSNSGGACTWSTVCCDPDWDCIDKSELVQVRAANTTNRTLACDAHEEATVIFSPGECVGWIVPNKRPTLARVSLDSDMCRTGADATAANIEFLDVCDWTVTSDWTSTTWGPHDGIDVWGCAGDNVLLAWDDSVCDWRVVGVDNHYLNEDSHGPIWSIECSSCGVTVRRVKSPIAVQQCSNCETFEDATGFDTTEVSVITGASTSCGTDSSGNPTCDMVFSTTKICVIDCDSGGTGSPVTVNFTMQEVVTDGELTWDEDTLEFCLKNYYTYVCTPCTSGSSTDTSCITFTDCEDDSSSS